MHIHWQTFCLRTTNLYIEKSEPPLCLHKGVDNHSQTAVHKLFPSIREKWIAGDGCRTIFASRNSPVYTHLNSCEEGLCLICLRTVREQNIHQYIRTFKSNTKFCDNLLTYSSSWLELLYCRLILISTISLGNTSKYR